MDKQLKAKLKSALVYVGLGLAALIAALGFGVMEKELTGVAIGFIAGGVGLGLGYIFAWRRSHLAREIAVGDDERNVYVRSRAGHSAFWISFALVFLVVMFRDYFPWSVTAVDMTLLIAMIVAYFGALIFFTRKY